MGKDENLDKWYLKIIFSNVPIPTPKHVDAAENSLNCSTRLAMLTLRSGVELRNSFISTGKATSPAMDNGVDPRDIKKIRDINNQLYYDKLEEILKTYPCYDAKTLHDINNKFYDKR